MLKQDSETKQFHKICEVNPSEINFADRVQPLTFFSPQLP